MGQRMSDRALAEAIWATIGAVKSTPSAADSGPKRDTLGARHAPLTQVVADSIRERVLAGEFQPGERLAEERLSAELGVSRMPVREALRALAAEGIVTLEPRRGASVTVYSEQQIRELVEVRATLESLNAKLAARRHDPGQIAELQAILEAGTRMNERSDLARIQENNARFHEAIAAIAANSILMNIVRSLRERTALIFAPRSRARVRQNWDEHAAIVRAVIAGDADLAALLAARHVYNAAQMPEIDEPRAVKSATAKQAAARKRPVSRRSGS